MTSVSFGSVDVMNAFSFGCRYGFNVPFHKRDSAPPMSFTASMILSNEVFKPVKISLVVLPSPSQSAMESEMLHNVWDMVM